ncbi:MAG TPA: hypothetical protein VGU21_00885 [Streptosporangiaceae bacterium]|nr:hypothetical protein [Streptosporangiaceae bacterium]
MSKHGSAAVTLAGLVLVGTVLAGMGLAGCSGSVPKGTTPQVTSNSAGSPGATAATSGTGTQASSASPGGSSAGQGAGQSASSATGSQPASRQGVASKSFAKANSIPFPVAVGNTWVYQTTAGGASGRTTNRIVAAGPGAAGYLVTMSSATSLAGAGSAGTAGYTFYPDGTIGYPAPAVDGIAVTGGGIRWPNAAALASGHAYHSTLQLQVGGSEENAGVNVYGAGTETVTVPAGTYQASVVETIIAAQGETIEVTTWIVQGVGTVKTEIQIHGAGTAGLTTSELLSFTKVKNAIGDGS